jgi:hypothetical protein
MGSLFFAKQSLVAEKSGWEVTPVRFFLWMGLARQGNPFLNQASPLSISSRSLLNGQVFSLFFGGIE